MKKLWLIIPLLVVLAGCCSKAPVSATPPFPQPTPAAIDKIQAIHDPDVDDWMVRLFKLKEQIEVALKAEASTPQPDSSN